MPTNKLGIIHIFFTFYPRFTMIDVPTSTQANAETLASKRTRCEIYTRVMGYYRPVTQFNQGKKSEFYSRSYFDVNTSVPRRDVNSMEDLQVNVCVEENTCA